jgi:hypothetical protein
VETAERGCRPADGTSSVPMERETPDYQTLTACFQSNPKNIIKCLLTNAEKPFRSPSCNSAIISGHGARSTEHGARSTDHGSRICLARSRSSRPAGCLRQATPGVPKPRCSDHDYGGSPCRRLRFFKPFLADRDIGRPASQPRIPSGAFLCLDWAHRFYRSSPISAVGICV